MQIRSTVLFVALLCSPQPLVAGLSLSPRAIPQEVPQDEFRVQLKRRLGRHAYFKKIGEMDWVWDYEGVVVAVQRTASGDAEYVGKVAAARSAPSRQMLDVFRPGLARELGLRQRDTAPRISIVVLASKGDFANYFNLVFRSKPGDLTSYYNPRDRLLLLYEDPFGTQKKSSPEIRQHELQQRAMQILHSFGYRGEALPDPYWLQSGMAQEILGGNDASRAESAGGSFGNWTYHKLCADIKDESRSATQLPSFEELFAFKDYKQVALAATKHARDLGVKAPQEWYAVQSFNAMAGALFHYLTYAASADVRARMKAFSTGAMKGKLKSRSFEQHFEGVDWNSVEHSFWRDVWKQNATRHPEQAHVDSTLRFFLAKRGGTSGGSAGADSSKLQLLSALSLAEDRLVLGIAAMRRGDSKSSLGIFDDALEQGFPSSKFDALALERERVQAWTQLRDGFLNYLVSSGKRLRITFQGEVLLSAIESYSNGKLLFASNARGIEGLLVSAFSVLELAKSMTRARSDFPIDWSVAYPFILFNDKKSSRWLKGVGPQRSHLTRDAKELYPRLADSIAAAGELLTLTTDPKEAPGPTARVVLAQERIALIESCWQRRDNVPFVRRIEAGLLDQAKFELKIQSSALELTELLAGEVQKYDDGRVWIYYDFSDPDQLRDWPLDPQPGHHGGLPAISVDPTMEIKQGRLCARGPVSRTHVLALEGPQSLLWKERVVLPEGQTEDLDDTSKILYFRFGLCTLADNSYAALENSLNFTIKDTSTNSYARTDAPENDTNFNTNYLNELQHDGQARIKLIRDGRFIHEADVRSRLTGHPSFFLHSDYEIEIDDVEVTGTITSESLLQLRNRWIEERLLTIGLGG